MKFKTLLKRNSLFIAVLVAPLFSNAQGGGTQTIDQDRGQMLTASLNTVPMTETQSGVDTGLPQLLPASPEPTAFVKAGVGNVNMSTGAATANIPLYTISMKNFSYPISLGYATQGLKADEASSRVGYGWVLNATGMITRSVKGEPDEFGARMAVPADFGALTENMYMYYQRATTPSSGYDTQPDEFQFNCNGYSGKFVLGNNYVPLVTSVNNIKVSVVFSAPSAGSTNGNIGIITITTPDGVKYRFGEHYEIATDFNVSRYSAYKGLVKTAFFLDRVDLPNGEYIDYHYTSLNTQSAVGITETKQIITLNGFDLCGSCPPGKYTQDFDRMSYKTYYLDSVTTSNKISVKFDYEGRPDISNDNRVKAIEIRGQYKPIKKYQLSYYNVPGTTSARTGRFFLMRVRDLNVLDVGHNVGLRETHDYIMNYNDLSDVPVPITFSQDYLGYYNGRASNWFIPNTSPPYDFSFRNPVGRWAKVGTLSSIQYATGGTEEFEYEPNTRSVQVRRNTMQTYDIEGRGGSGSFFYMYNITVPKTQTVTLDAYSLDAIATDGYSADPAQRTLSVWIYEGTGLIASRSAMGYLPTTGTFTLQAGHTYYMKMEVVNNTEIGYASITYDNSLQPVYDNVNEEIPGVRLRQIRFTDPYGSAPYSKYFTYAALDNLSASTGAAYSAGYETNSILRINCLNQNFTECKIRSFSSSSTNRAYGYAGSGSVIYYTHVIESDQPDLSNGGTEYIFFPNENGGTYNQIKGEAINDLPGGQAPTLSGVLQKKRFFNAQKTVIREETNVYSTFIYSDNLTPSILVRKRYEPNTQEASRFDAFDVVYSDYRRYWYQLDATLVTIKEGPIVSQSTAYLYSSPADNILPSQIITTNSLGEELKVVRKYPNSTFDSNSRGAFDYARIANSGRINEVVQEHSYKNGVLVTQKNIYYKDWFNNGKIMEPEFVEIKESSAGAVHDVIQYISYNEKGDVTEVRKSNDLSTVYLWDPILQLPICEVKNAELARVAYTGFENNANGSWQLLGTLDTIAFTGRNSLSGSLQKTITLPGTYTVTLWSKGTPTVNNTNGNLVETINGWSLYSWELTNPAAISVVGTQMDEVRLLPREGYMQTFTYEPFVGMTAKSDPNNRFSRYEYDSFNRIQVVKDHKGNVLRTVSYHYQGQ